MKKLLLLTLLCFILSNCEIKTTETKASNTIMGYNGYSLYTEIKNQNNMKYLILYSVSYQHAAIATINLTRDSLEIEYLKKQLNNP